MFAHVEDGVVLTDADGRITDWSPGAERLFGRSRAEALGQPIAHLLPTGVGPEGAVALQDALRHGGHWGHDDLPFRRPDGATGRLEAIVVPVLDDTGRPTGGVAVLRDVTARRAELAAARELDRLKTEFLHTVSHELRTPLTIIHGFAELLATRPGTADARTQRMGSQIYEASGHLTRLVEDLLDFARIERGEVRVAPEDLDLAPVLSALAAGFQQRPGGARLTAELAPRLLARADPARTAQAVANLLDNALKYAPEGSVMLRATQVPGGVRVAVADQGPGLGPAEQVRVWERFYRTDWARERGVGGSGIGLAVVKALVEAQGGRVGVDSAPGQGVTFWLELPAPGAP